MQFGNVDVEAENYEMFGRVTSEVKFFIKLGESKDPFVVKSTKKLAPFSQGLPGTKR